MKRIKISIPDNLTPQQEVIAIAKGLQKKMLTGGTGNIAIGNGVEVIDLQTHILIDRTPSEKAIVTHECGVCKTVFERKRGKVLHTNYGGNKRKLYYCSDECREVMMSICGEGRASINGKLKPLINFHKR